MRKLGGTGFAIVALALGGCGSAGSTTTRTVTASGAKERTPAASTKAQFIAKADAICRESKARKAALKPSLEALKGETETQQLEGAIPLLRKGISISRDELAKFTALPRPPGDTATIEKIQTGFGEEETDGTNAADALAERDSAATEAARTALTKVESYVNGLAQGYGFKDCGKREE